MFFFFFNSNTYYNTYQLWFIDVTFDMMSITFLFSDNIENKPFKVFGFWKNADN